MVTNAKHNDVDTGTAHAKIKSLPSLIKNNTTPKINMAIAIKKCSKYANDGGVRNNPNDKPVKIPAIINKIMVAIFTFCPYWLI
jgi:hypothetical protein